MLKTRYRTFFSRAKDPLQTLLSRVGRSRLRQAILLLPLLAPTSATAQERTRLFGIGHVSQLDTYLSPEHYGGLEVRYVYDSSSRLKRDSLWSRTTLVQGFLSTSEPRSGDATDLGGMFEASYGMHRTVFSRPRFQIAVGAQADGFIGGLYNTRNGNNPAQMKLGIDLAPAVKATYWFRLWGKSMPLSYKASLPLVGLQFSPAYGQSYYEIFNRGNYDHNVCFYSPFSGVSFAQRLTLSVPFGKTALTFGYLGDYRQAEFNSLKYHSFTHGFVIGWTVFNN